MGFAVSQELLRHAALRRLLSHSPSPQRRLRSTAAMDSRLRENDVLQDRRISPKPRARHASGGTLPSPMGFAVSQELLRHAALRRLLSHSPSPQRRLGSTATIDSRLRENDGVLRSVGF